MTDLAIVGAGITGLAAAWEAVQRGARVTLIEPGRVGGKVRTTPFDGAALDESADAFLARVPEGLELCRELGIEGDLVSPAARTAYVWSHGALRPLPAGHVLGVPTDLDALAASGVVSPAAVERAGRDLTIPLTAPEGDVEIGACIRERLGDEVLERLVDPLVGGINAGDCDRLSMAATVPQLDAALRSGRGSLIEACRAQRAAAPDPEAPVFFAPRGGMGQLIDALAGALLDRGAELVTTAATAIERDGSSWQVRTGDGPSITADGVVVTVPAPVAAGLVEPHAAEAATHLASIEMASVVLVSFAVAADAVDRELDASGFLVPRPEGRLLTACSWSSSKWAHLGGDGTVWLRASVGRDGDDRASALTDDALVEHVRRDLADTMALRGAPDEVRISRWPASLPQYRVGHLDLVAGIERDLAERAPRLAVTGAAFRGLGVPACIRQGRAAARSLVA